MLKEIIIFSAGGLVGGIAGYFICKKKYGIVEAEEVKGVVNPHKDAAEVRESQDKYEQELYSASYVRKDKKTGDEEWEEAEKVGPTEPEMVPYQISPEAFADEHPEYAKSTLVYYEDNEVLINDEEECVDIGSTIGHDAINHFGDFEKDAVFIRNEALGNDYEVLLEHAAFGEDEQRF